MAFDKRQHRRYDLSIKAFYSPYSKPNASIKATIINLSIGGFCFDVEEFFEEGTHLFLSIPLDDNVEQARLKVKVIWIKILDQNHLYRIGVQIINQDTPDFEEFMEFYKKKIEGMLSDDT